MLNGKFFTGLPPKMMDRAGAGSRNCNRLESSLFWPDDTQTDTAVESRTKRRNSVQLANSDKHLHQKQNSIADNDVDTKKRFTKEFSQSSIQFYDNLNENRDNSSRPQLRRSMANTKRDITEKPTNTKLKLPDSVANEAYTADKRKQAYTSNIEFYDYVTEREEGQNNRNNLRKPKMDMNDKRELELNSKNSPKLQVKRDVRSLSEEKEQRKINNRDVKTVERSTHNNINDIYNEKKRFAINEENYLQSRRSVEPRMNVSPKRGSDKTTINREKHYSSEREINRESESFPYEERQPVYYENFEVRNYRRDIEEPKPYKSERFSPRDYEKFDDNPSYRRKIVEPRRMMRNNSRHYYKNRDENDYSQIYQANEEIENIMRNVHLELPPPRKQYYTADECYDDESQVYYRHNDQVQTPTNHGSLYKRSNYDDRAVDLPYQNPKQINSDSIINKEVRKEAMTTPTSPLPSDAESSVSAANSQKHLRSSLCFNNGEIIGKNDATGSPTPTQYPTQRRNARSSATQRVSVGLPD